MEERIRDHATSIDWTGKMTRNLVKGRCLGAPCQAGRTQKATAVDSIRQVVDKVLFKFFVEFRIFVQNFYLLVREGFPNFRKTVKGKYIKFS